MALDDFEMGEFDEDYSSDPNFYFNDFLARGDFSRALDIFEKNNLKIGPNNGYVSSVEDLALKAAYDHSSNGNYEGAYVSLLMHAPKNPRIKSFARAFAADMLPRLVDAYDNFEEEDSVDLINELTYDIHCIERAHFPETLMFQKGNDFVSVSSIIDGHRVAKLFENYFSHVDSFNIDSLVVESCEEQKKLDREFRLFDDAYSNVSFIGYVNQQRNS